MKKHTLLLFPVLILIFSCESTSVSESTKETPAVESVDPVKEASYASGEMMLHKTYHKNGQVRTEGNLLKGKKDGKWISWYENGMPWSETWFENGKKNGSTTAWHANGKKFYEGHFKNDKETGKWIYWDEQGNVLKEVEY